MKFTTNITTIITYKVNRKKIKLQINIKEKNGTENKTTKQNKTHYDEQKIK